MYICVRMNHMPDLIFCKCSMLKIYFKRIGAVSISLSEIICPAFFGFGIAASRHAFGAAPKQYYPSSAAPIPYFSREPIGILSLISF